MISNLSKIIDRIVNSKILADIEERVISQLPPDMIKPGKIEEDIPDTEHKPEDNHEVDA